MPKAPLKVAAALALAAMLPAAASAAAVKLSAFDRDGRPLDAAGLLRLISPASKDRAAPGGGILVTDLAGRPVPGRPWLREIGGAPALEWRDAQRIRVTLPWPVEGDGFSTAILDGGGKGYADGQGILLNEEIAVTAYRRMQDSLRDRQQNWRPPYRPSRRVLRLVDAARGSVAQAHAVSGPGKRSRRFDAALSAVCSAWSQLLFEHGEQIARDPKGSEGLRWGLSLDETVVDRVKDYDWIAEQVSGTGADWVRLVFRSPPGDFSFSRKDSFTLYDELVERLRERRLRIMGSVLDSLLWPKDVSPDAFRDRARNLAEHYKGRIGCWEVASEPNGTWLGGEGTPVSGETILAAIRKATAAIKAMDASIETVATLHWWDGTAPDDRHALGPWLRWAASQGFGGGIDVLGISLYPDRHPVGLSLEPAFQELHRAFPEKRLMLAGFSYGQPGEKEPQGYWWLEPGNLDGASKDLIYLYAGAAPAMPASIGGGFFWPTLGEMLQPDKRKTTSKYRVYKETIDRLKR